MKKYIVILIIFCAFLPKGASAMNDKLFSACLINPVTDEIIWEKDSDKPHAMASTTKILTAIIALEKADGDEIVTVSRNAAYTEGSSAYTKEGDQYRMEELIYGLMLNSGNDAAVAVAEHISGSTQAFSELMNDYAYNIIGVKNTSFQNPNGLEAQGHYTTAYDLAKIAAYAMKNEDFRRIAATKVIGVTPQNRDEEMFYVNHNKLLNRYEGCIGIKTGYTKATGRCLVSAAERDGMMFIAVTLDDSDDWNTHAELLDYAFSEHYPKTVVKAGDIAREEDGHRLVYERDLTVPVRRGVKSSFEVVNHFAPRTAPANEGEKVGYAEVFYGGRKIETINIISGEEKNQAPEGSFMNELKRILGIWL
ncbi:MAG: D-alanyl-D-alanine carboxypeptidase [Clostridiales bacterium]|nr:D-alanyl-D-alanine carboxypeptidase [Clostridiales bacterium]